MNASTLFKDERCHASNSAILLGLQVIDLKIKCLILVRVGLQLDLRDKYDVEVDSNEAFKRVIGLLCYSRLL